MSDPTSGQSENAVPEDDIEEGLRRLLIDDEEISEVQGRRLIGRLSRTITRIESSQSSIMPASMMAEYNGVIEDGAERIMRMTESQHYHRIQKEDWVIRNDIIKSYVGLILGFAIIMTSLYFGYALVQDGHSAQGLLLGLPPIIFAAGAYAWGVKDRKKQVAPRYDPEATVEESSSPAMSSDSDDPAIDVGDGPPRRLSQPPSPE